MKTLLIIFSLFVSQSFAASFYVPVGPLGNATSIWNIPISSTAPTDAQVVGYNATTNQWLPITQSGSGSSSLPSLASGKYWVGNSGNLPVAVTASGDATFGNTGAYKVTAIQGSSVSSTAPTAAQFLVYNATVTTWFPTLLSGDATFSVSGAAKVSAIQGVGISTTSPAAGQLLTYNSVVSQWRPEALGSGSLPGLTTTTFWVGNASNLPVAVASSGDATFSGAGAFKVLAIQGVGISTTSPSASQLLTYNSVTSTWRPEPLSSGVLPGLTSTKFWVGNASNLPIAVSSSGDASFNGSGAFKVLALQGVSISTASPSSGQLLTYNSVTSAWTPQTSAGGGSSFNQGGNAFGATATLGTTDNNVVSIVANSTEALRLTTAGAVGIKLAGASQADANSSLYFNVPDAGARFMDFQKAGASGFTIGYENNTGFGARIGLIRMVPNENLAFATNGNNMRMVIDNTGQVGIGSFSTTFPTLTAVFDQSGSVRMRSFGSGAATFDASGNISSVSDERLKDIQRPYMRGLEAIKGLQPITYKWNKKSGLELEHEYSGFSAQNVRANIPEGVGQNREGYLSLQDRAILATLVNAVKELSAQIEELKKAGK